MLGSRIGSACSCVAPSAFVRVRSLLESAKLAGVDPETYLKTAARAALNGETIPLPHEISAE